MIGPDPSPDLAFRTLAELVTWLKRAPDGTRLEAQEVARILDAVADEAPADLPPSGDRGDRTPEPWSWRERLWIVPAETRIGVVELAEALGRPKSFIYARTGAKADDSIPHRKLEGILIFTAGEVRAWIRAQEQVVAGGPMHSTTDERAGRLHVL